MMPDGGAGAWATCGVNLYYVSQQLVRNGAIMYVVAITVAATDHTQPHRNGNYTTTSSDTEQQAQT